MVGTRFYFDVGNYVTMLRLVRAETDKARRRKLLAAFLVGVPLMVAIHAVCFALDPLLFGSLRRTEVREPVFSVGHARSGTTYLHRLMAQDRRFSVVLMYEMFFPSLLEKKLLRLLFRADETLFGKRLRRKIDEVEERTFAETNDMHRTGFFAAEEDDFLLTWSLGSGFWIVLFPYLGQLDFYHVDRWSERKRRRMMTFYKECVRRQLALNGGGTHLSKNPTFCGRVEALIETFPDAKFIVPMRNPYETIPSLLKMLQTSWALQGRDDRLILESLAILADQSFDSYCHPLEVLARHPEIRSCVVDYRDLVGQPAVTMTRVYDELDLTMPPEVAAAVSASRGQGHETTHRYSLEEFGLEPEAIHLRLAALFDQFGWDSEGEHAGVN
ncbi:sulfotransferase family protein [Mycobacterium sp. BK086]|uniref:sulfotransferase family protein n=1 Tax=Mycobacterium sp. BK086 TaxID=2512165 RepID=UPI00105EAB27|nr:sulfotransferase [Mycobacterium sp. BK086]TDO12047.1 sulfotransferase family protein [Mycobacterium sp. BK086]